jgi:hypothetical protein
MYPVLPDIAVPELVNSAMMELTSLPTQIFPAPSIAMGPMWDSPPPVKGPDDEIAEPEPENLYTPLIVVPPPIHALPDPSIAMDSGKLAPVLARTVPELDSSVTIALKVLDTHTLPKPSTAGPMIAPAPTPV